MNENINIKDAAEAVKGIVEAVPVYQDLAQPAVQEIGKGLHTLSKVIHIALAPVSAAVWGYEKISNYVQNSLEKKLENVPPENIIPPDISVAGPALEALRFVGDKEELREMFSKLLSTSMNSEINKFAHPSFVEIIKQLSSDEAKILKSIGNESSMPLIKVRIVEKETGYYSEPLVNFTMLPFESNCDHVELGPSYINNLNRLGLISVSYTQYKIGENVYEPLENHTQVKYWDSTANDLSKTFEIHQGILKITDFGTNFYNACIK